MPPRRLQHRFCMDFGLIFNRFLCASCRDITHPNTNANTQTRTNTNTNTHTHPQHKHKHKHEHTHTHTTTSRRRQIVLSRIVSELASVASQTQIPTHTDTNTSHLSAETNSAFPYSFRAYQCCLTNANKNIHTQTRPTFTGLKRRKPVSISCMSATSRRRQSLISRIVSALTSVASQTQTHTHKHTQTPTTSRRRRLLISRIVSEFTSGASLTQTQKHTHTHPQTQSTFTGWTRRKHVSIPACKPPLGEVNFRFLV